MSSKSLLDLMPKAEAEKAIKRGQERMARQRAKKSVDISPEIYMVAEFGYYFGWDAMMAIRRGYTVEPGTNKKEPLTLDEALVLLEGARKVWYAKLIEQAHSSVVGNSFRSASGSFDNAIKPFAEKSEVKG